MDHNPSSRRPHHHRGRRGTERRGTERRTPQQAAEQTPRSSGEVDVDQIMREIRSRVSQRHGIDLTPQQIQELAARRLEAILDPRNVSPTLFDQLRKGAATPPEPTLPAGEGDLAITEEAIYEGSGLVRFFRRLLNPLLKLLFNPAPVIAALQTQSRINREALARAAERERRQTEWNALHYQVLQRLVTEVSRNSLEVQALVTRVEALGARVDFNDRRIRTIESTPAPVRSQRTHETSHQPAPAPVENVAAEPSTSQPAHAAAPSGQPDGQRRKRRRRRGRRGPASGVEAAGLAATGLAAAGALPDDGLDEEDDEQGPESESPTADAAASSASTMPESAPVEVTPEPALVEVTPEPAQAMWPTPGPAPSVVEPTPPPAPEPDPVPPVDAPDGGTSRES